MKIIAVETDVSELVGLSECIRKAAPPGASVECFRDPLFVYQYAAKNKPDAIFALADMRRLSGIEMAATLRKAYPWMKIYIIWQDGDYRAAAKACGADGYLVKPVTKERVKRLLSGGTQEWEGGGWT